MPQISGFTFTEVLISLFLLCLTGLGALSVSLLARQQAIVATQQTIALSLTLELTQRIASHTSPSSYEGIHPLWQTAPAVDCTQSSPCDAEQLSRYHLYSTLTASGHLQSLQLLQQPVLCIAQQGGHQFIQLSWRSMTNMQIQRPASVCDLPPHRLQVSVVAP